MSFPTTVDLAITGACNLRCKHCNTADTWSVDNELSMDELKGILDQLKEEKVFNLSIFGGEPFFYPRIFEFFSILNDYPMRVTILTNGTLIDEKAVEEIKKLRFLEKIQISVDGASPETHDWQRGEGSFNRSIKAVKLLIENDIPVKIKAIINTRNYMEIENMSKMAMELGLDGMDFGDAVECGQAAVYAGDVKFTGKIHKQIMRTLFDIRKEFPSFSIGGTMGQKMEMLDDFYRKGPGKGTRGNFSTCPAGHNMLSIRSDGKVVPCSAFWTLVCGDARKTSLSDIWRDSEVLAGIRSLADEPIRDAHAECASCDYMSFCNAGCRAAAYYSSGNDMRGRDPVTCLVFSDLRGCRLERALVLGEENLEHKVGEAAI